MRRGPKIIAPHLAGSAELHADFQDHRIAAANGREKAIIDLEVMFPFVHDPTVAMLHVVGVEVVHHPPRSQGKRYRIKRGAVATPPGWDGRGRRKRYSRQCAGAVPCPPARRYSG